MSLRCGTQMQRRRAFAPFHTQQYIMQHNTLHKYWRVQRGSFCILLSTEETHNSLTKCDTAFIIKTLFTKSPDPSNGQALRFSCKVLPQITDAFVRFDCTACSSRQIRLNLRLLRRGDGGFLLRSSTPYCCRSCRKSLLPPFCRTDPEPDCHCRPPADIQ